MPFVFIDIVAFDLDQKTNILILKDILASFLQNSESLRASVVVVCGGRRCLDGRLHKVLADVTMYALACHD